MFYRGLCACTAMLCMCVVYVSFVSKERHRIIGCIVMDNVVLFIFRSRLLLYYVGRTTDREYR